MTIDRLINIINENPPLSLIDDQEIILSELRELGLRLRDQQELMDKILNVAKITKNPKTRESFFRSYFRTFQKGIYKDGRNSSITIEITKRCNKHCKYCYSNFHGESQKIDDYVLDLIIDFARKEYKHIFLTGGEPTLDHRVFSLAERNPDIMFFMFTNGSTITEDYAKRLSCSGNLVPILGIDGSSQSMHDCFKGEGSYREIMRAIERFNENNVSWGYISMITEINARDVLDQKFVENMKKKGAFIARYLEYLPVGPHAKREFILSGETYYLLEKRKKEIIESGDIYIQETVQNKCTGLLSFDVNGNIKKCPFFHYAKHNVTDGNIKESVKRTMRDWVSYDYDGECPLYSDPMGFKNHLKKMGWKHIYHGDEEYLCNSDVAQQLVQNYRRFLEIKEDEELTRT